MTPHFFYHEDLTQKDLTLDEDTSRHIAVLRLEPGDDILLTDGKGRIATAVIKDAHRKKSTAEIRGIEEKKQREKEITIAISLIKNTSRFEWFLEKATEIGVSEIIPLLCERTEKEKFRYDRMNNILISAMLQSQQCRLPVLHQPTAFEEVIKKEQKEKKFIAHCFEENKQELNPALITHHSSLILIGPEGDFTPAEIEAAMQQSFVPVTLGATRLRTETAGIVAATLLMHLSKEFSS